VDDQARIFPEARLVERRPIAVEPGAAAQQALPARNHADSPVTQRDEIPGRTQ
jgi:hypothetical protein